MTRVQDVYPDDRVSLREVGLRDGLQLVKKFPSTAAKQRWIRDEYGAGVRIFEVGSFLPAKTFPQFADVRDIVATIAALPGDNGAALLLAVDEHQWIRGADHIARDLLGLDKERLANGVPLSEFFEFDRSIFRGTSDRDIPGLR